MARLSDRHIKTTQYTPIPVAVTDDITISEIRMLAREEFNAAAERVEEEIERRTGQRITVTATLIDTKLDHD